MVRPHSRRCRNAGSGFLLSWASCPAASCALCSQMILPQSRPLQSKIWIAAPVPSMNHALSGTSAETAVPGTPSTDKAATSEAARAARRSQSTQLNDASVCTIRSARLRHGQARLLSKISEIEAPEVPVHQPPDHEDDKDQTDDAADPDWAALTVI